jgi:hypothetical protein
MRRIVGMHEAKTHLSTLVSDALAGDEIICLALACLLPVSFRLSNLLG